MNAEYGINEFEISGNISAFALYEIQNKSQLRNEFIVYFENNKNRNFVIRLWDILKRYIRQSANY